MRNNDLTVSQILSRMSTSSLQHLINLTLKAKIMMKRPRGYQLVSRTKHLSVAQLVLTFYFQYGLGPPDDNDDSEQELEDSEDSETEQEDSIPISSPHRLTLGDRPVCLQWTSHAHLIYSENLFLNRCRNHPWRFNLFSYQRC
jgi:hypothetical protein